MASPLTAAAACPFTGTFAVDTTADSIDASEGDSLCADASGKCSLRAAVMEANACPGSVTVNVPPGVYMLTLPRIVGVDIPANGDLDILDAMTIRATGVGLVVVDALMANDRVLEIGSGFGADAGAVRLEGLVIRAGRTTDSGGGLRNVNINTAGTSLVRCTVTENSAALGGGVANEADDAILNLYDVTISRNIASGDGGGVYSTYGGNETVRMVQTTIAYNLASTSGGGSGGGLYIGDSGTYVLDRSIIAYNSDGSTSPDTNDCSGQSYPLDQPVGTTNIVTHNDNDICLASATLLNVDPLLDPLTYRGGNTLVHPLRKTSPAVDSGGTACTDPLVAPDQRLAPRPFDGDGNGTIDCDLGAFELQGANVTISKESCGTAIVGEPLHYHIQVTNTGGETAHAVVVTDVLPSGASFVSATPTHGSCSNAAGTITCALGDLAPGETVVIDLVVTPTAAGSLTNAATVQTPDDSNSSDNTSSTTVTVQTNVDLSVLKTADSAATVAGNTATFTITAHNGGTAAAPGVVVSDPLPNGLAFVSATASQGNCTNDAGLVTCALGTLAAGASATVTIVTEVTLGGQITNRALVHGDVIDPNASNDSAAVTLVSQGPTSSSVAACGNAVFRGAGAADGCSASSSTPGAGLVLFALWWSSRRRQHADKDN